MDRRHFFTNSMNAIGLLCINPYDFTLIPKCEKSEFSPLEIEQPGIIPLPDSPETWDGFRELLHNWRREVRDKISYDDFLYRKPEFNWVTSAFNCYFLMMNDETFYDKKTNSYKVEEFLDNNEKEFGRLDTLVLWHAYPRIGLDERNQFDFYREMPGGLSKIKEISNLCHQRNIKVYIDYNPWDTGTRRENVTDIEALTQIIADIDADGIFLDTMSSGATEFREKLDSVKPGIVLESELSLPVQNIFNHHMSWAQEYQDSNSPGILRNKWIERRHMQHGISRWNRDRTKELQTAWMNGSGLLIWENIFGQWNGWNQKDKSILRSMSPIQKRYSELFSGEGWIPMADKVLAGNVFSSCWKGKGIRLWTLVNRSEIWVEGRLLKIRVNKDESIYDLVQGTGIKPERKGQDYFLSCKIAPRGIGCFIAGSENEMGTDFQDFLTSQAAIYKKWDLNTGFPAIATKLRSPNSTIQYKKPLQDMTEIPSYKGNLEVVFLVREVGFYESIDSTFVDMSRKMHKERAFIHEVDLPPFLMDKYPVTNLQYLRFLNETGYKPHITLNFLKHWINGEIPAGKENHPVVYIDLDDARAYAKWAGKRLPTEFEWQFAGQGFEKRVFPWGNSMNEDFCNGGKFRGTLPVDSFPEGISVFGCYDMCGNTWELTESEYSDGRNSFCILKGGSFYKAKGSGWYFDGGPKPLNFSAKQLLFYPGLDRCSTVGFRCAADLSK